MLFFESFVGRCAERIVKLYPFISTTLSSANFLPVSEPIPPPLGCCVGVLLLLVLLLFPTVVVLPPLELFLFVFPDVFEFAASDESSTDDVSSLYGKSEP